MSAIYCRSPGSIPGQSICGFLVDKVTVGQIFFFFWILRSCPVMVIPALLHAHLFTYHPSYIVSAIESVVKQRTKREGTKGFGGNDFRTQDESKEFKTVSPLRLLFWIWWRRGKSLSLPRIELPTVQSIISNFVGRDTVPQIHEIKKVRKSNPLAFRTVPAVKPTVLRKTWCWALHLCCTLFVIVLGIVYLERLLPRSNRLATVLSCIHICLISPSLEASSCIVSQEIAHT